MNFDKTKAMRNAERYLAQGKLRSAINEYKQVIAHDPKDFGTMNMLGDLYVKNSETKHAVGCYTSVAEHYSNQGFAQKAIAIYNKITKLEPNSVEISEKLAELYKFKGSVREARSHYVTLAEHYEKNGRKVEALAIWKQIAMLDPNNTEVYLTVAESYLKENEFDEAAEAYTEAGLRFAKAGQHDTAVQSFSKALDLKPGDRKTLAAFVESKFALGQAEEAVQKLAELHEKEPHNREVLDLLIDCHLASNNLPEAEKATIKLVEIEPACYPKFLELVRVYLKNDDLVSASRVLSMSSEHLLLNGQAVELGELITEILDKDAEQLDALRLLTRYCSWQRDEGAFRDSLERLARVARTCEAVDDEHYALSQLVMIMPQEPAYAERLREINDLHGFEARAVDESLFDKQFLKDGPTGAPAEFETFAVVEAEAEIADGEIVADAELSADFAIVNAAEGSSSGFEVVETFEPEAVGSQEPEAEEFSPQPTVEAGDDNPSAATDGDRLQKEIDSIKFYIDSGYLELAEKAVHELRGEFGECPEVTELRSYLAEHSGGVTEEPAAANEIVTPAAANGNGNGNGSYGFDIDDLRSELGLEEPEAADDSDYETHYHTAVAYQEMGLLEGAIKEFQEAVSLVTPSDGTRRFFACANLLGHCFMQKGMPNLALTWYQRTLETPGLNDEEKQALWYELAVAYEAEGDLESAGRYFEQVYAENIDFRDVSERVRNITVNH